MKIKTKFVCTSPKVLDLMKKASLGVRSSYLEVMAVEVIEATEVIEAAEVLDGMETTQQAAFDFLRP